MSVRSIVVAAFIATAVPAFAQPPAGSEPRGRGPEPAQAPRGGPATTPQARTPEPQRASPPPPATLMRREGQPVNVKVEFTLTDQRTGGAAPVKRTVSMVVADGRTGQIRSVSEVIGISGGNVPLNIDASPDLLTDGKIRLGFNLQYDWPAPLEQTDRGGALARGTVTKTAMHDSATLIVESGKSMVAAQSADPIGDRQVMVEVKATVLR